MLKVNEVLKIAVISKHDVRQITPKSELLLQMQRERITQKCTDNTLRNQYDSELSRLQRDDDEDFEDEDGEENENE